ncbi:SLATT domain-containing protein [Seleniivibrio woodruffii]|uniref:SMODS and SLOG-associating 2TM effector domain-containing protein n=1 Tax=Seleniivibrio woodruffii TaxID=1078050 RepID=A0A4R1K3E5_9BACT|nr:SLATT domain-containing protein [Seleniivibrio woodruffii]TCK58387.1 hypothetical protein C8D98_2589 [Seleniivibrio woodruffii]TVZ36760.1 hypothetical protein OF66_2398 [Seleniivibrio woodruffii]
MTISKEETLGKIQNKIYITRLSRIQASERLLNNKKWSEYLLVYYSIVNIVYSYFSVTSICSSVYLEHLNILLSIILLIISLIVAKNRFSERSHLFQDNYTALDNLYYKACESNADPIEIMDEYSQLLNNIENHLAQDYIVMKVKRFLSGNAINNGKPTAYEFYQFTEIYITSQIIVPILFIIPILTPIILHKTLR